MAQCCTAYTLAAWLAIISTPTIIGLGLSNGALQRGGHGPGQGGLPEGGLQGSVQHREAASGAQAALEGGQQRPPPPATPPHRLTGRSGWGGEGQRANHAHHVHANTQRGKHTCAHTRFAEVEEFDTTSKKKNAFVLPSPLLVATVRQQSKKLSSVEGMAVVVMGSGCVQTQDVLKILNA